MQEKEARPPYVMFHRGVVEDRSASIAAGTYMTKDLDYVTIIPPGGKSDVVKPAEEWLSSIQATSRTDPSRFPPEWARMYTEAYAAWKKGEEIPENGVPIKGWSLLSPAQQETCIRCHLRTVEDLAKAPEEAIAELGMGGRSIVQKAKDWLSTRGDGGSKLVSEVEALRIKNASQEEQIKKMQEQIAVLVAQPKVPVKA